MKNVTIKDIAEQADVSIATVSRVINNIGQVKPETKNKVLSVAEEMGYFQKNLSNSIKEASNTILMIIPDFENPFTSSVMNGVLDSINHNKYKIIFVSVKNFNNTLSDYLSFCTQFSLAGIISLSSIPDPSIIDALGRKYPMVMCSEYPENNNLSFVSIDDDRASSIAVEYLLSLGRNKIAFVNNSTKNKYARHRQKGYIKTLNKHMIPINDSWILNLNKIDYSLAFTNIQSILKQEEKPNAIFAVSDVYAVAAVNAIKSVGLRVPEDISVIGFDNEYVSMMSVPAITTIMQPAYNIGFQSAELLFEIIKNPKMKQRNIIFETELIVRDSTAKL